jgi:hypothetical protein
MSMPGLAWIPLILIVGALAGGGALVAKSLSGIAKKMIEAFAAVVGLIAWLCTKITTWVIGFYEPFIVAGNNAARIDEVSQVWIAVRDIANLLLIIVLLFSAILVIIRYEKGNYTIKQVLPKVVGAVLLINFSKLIIQIIIDFFHVMAGGIYQLLSSKSVGPANSAPVIPAGSAITEANAPLALIESLDYKHYLRQSTIMMYQGDFSNIEAAAAIVLVLVVVFTIMVTSISILMIYLTRFIALAMLICISPLAMVAGVLPMTQQYAKKFWEVVIKNASVGAILAMHFALAFKMVTIFDEIGAKLTTNTASFGDGEQFKYPYSEQHVPGFAMVGWNEILKILFVLVLVKNAAKAAKSTSFAEGVISTTEGAINGFGKRMARKPVDWTKKAAVKSAQLTGQGLKKIPIMPTSIGKWGRPGDFRSVEDIQAGFGKWREKTKANRARDLDMRSTEVAGKFARGASNLIPSETAKRTLGFKDTDHKSFSVELETKKIEELEKVHGSIGVGALKKRIEELNNIHPSEYTEDHAREMMVLLGKVKDHANTFNEADADILRSAVGKADKLYMDKGDNGRGHRERLFTGMDAAGRENTRLSTKGKMADKLLENDGKGNLKSNEEWVARRFGPQAIAKLDPKLIKKYMDNHWLDEDSLQRLHGDPKLMDDIVVGRAEVKKMVEDAVAGSYAQVPEGTTGPGGSPGSPGTSPAMDYETPDSELLREYQEGHKDSLNKVSFGRFLRDDSGQTMAANFGDQRLQEAIPGIENMAGVFIKEGEEKARIINALAASYEDQLRGELQEFMDGKLTGVRAERAPKSETDIASMVDQFKQTAANKKSIRLINKARLGRNARHIYQHEGYHEGLEDLGPDQIRQYWEELGEAEQENARNLIKAQYGGDMNDMEVAEEFFAEGLANTGRHAEDNGIVIKNQELAEKIKADILSRKQAASLPEGDRRDIEQSNGVLELQKLQSEKELLEQRLASSDAQALGEDEVERIRSEISKIEGLMSNFVK